MKAARPATAAKAEAERAPAPLLKVSGVWVAFGTVVLAGTTMVPVEDGA